MKREDIEKAAGDYSGSILGFRDNESVMAKHNAFADGAEWRINSVWHDASEEPINGEIVLGMSLHHTPFILGPNHEEYRVIIQEFHIMRWAYMKDLIPEMEE